MVQLTHAQTLISAHKSARVHAFIIVVGTLFYVSSHIQTR